MPHERYVIGVYGKRPEKPADQLTEKDMAPYVEITRIATELAETEGIPIKFEPRINEPGSNALVDIVSGRESYARTLKARLDGLIICTKVEYRHETLPSAPSHPEWN